MNADDRIMLAKCFLFSMKILFALLYAATDRVDKQLYADYRGLADDLKRWYAPGDTGDTPPDDASIKARWSG